MQLRPLTTAASATARVFLLLAGCTTNRGPSASFFRREILTNRHTQVVLMSVDPGDDVGAQVHAVDPNLVFVSGTGDALLDSQRSRVQPRILVATKAEAVAAESGA